MQYAALVHLFARCSGLEAGELVHVIADAHIYDRHVPLVEQLMERESYPAPVFWLDPAVRDFYDVTVDGMALENYQCAPGIGKIPVAI